jgi:hypothetical protein
VVRLRPRTGNRGAALFLLGVLMTIIGVGQLVQPPDSPVAKANLVVIVSIVPFDVITGLWLVIGLYALAAAWVPKLQPWAYAAVTGMFFFFALGYGLTWVIGQGIRAWFVALLYLALTATTLIISGWEERP